MMSDAERATSNLSGGLTETVMEHAQNPRNVGEIPDPEGVGAAGRECGDIMQVWLRIKNGKIEKATFLTNGCGTVVAAGSAVTELAKGRTVLEAARIRQEDIAGTLGGLPEEHVHCAQLAALALHEAIRDYFAFRKEPWKRAYRKF